jgi:hypothetical protein
MDRKLCVLLYSQYSPASKALLEHIAKQSFDIAQVTGLTMLCIDTEDARIRAELAGVTSVPCILIQYFDDTKMTLVDDDVYKFIASINRAVSVVQQPSSELQRTILQPPSGDQQLSLQQSISSETTINPIKSQHKSITDIAAEMQQARDKAMADSDKRINHQI